jgi:hypothetical protein
MTMLTEKALLLAKVETNQGEDAAPVVALNSILVQDPGYDVDVNVIERPYARPDLSRFKNRMGRKLGQMTFTVDLQGNGKVQSGDLSDAPKLATLLQGCGFALSELSGTNQIGNVVPGEGNEGSVGWTKGGSPTVTQPVLYELVCTTAGTSGTAAFSIKSKNPSVDPLDTTITLTNAQAVELGNSGAEIVPTISGAAALGDRYHVLVVPVGLQAVPVSDSFKSLTLYLYCDGLLHKITGAMGTFSITAEAGETGTVEFTFTGNHITPVDTAFPSIPASVFEPQHAPLIENSLLTLNGNTSLVPGGFSFEQSNNVNPRVDANAPEGFNGVRIGSRAPAGSFSPEVELEASHPFWSTFEDSLAQHFMARVGAVAGNQIILEAPRAQAQSIGAGDRDGLRTYELALSFYRNLGNDEIRFIFA